MNSDLNRDVQLPTIATHFKTATERPNPVIVKATHYSQSPNSLIGRRRPKDVLLDPDDKIKTDNTDMT